MTEVEKPAELLDESESVAWQSLADVRKDLDKLDERIDGKLEKLDFGLLAFVWLFIAGGSGAPSIRIAASNGPLYGIAALCILSLVFGFSQNVVARRVLKRAHDSAEAQKRDKVSFDPSSREVRVLYWLWRFKIAFAVVAALWLCVLLVFAVR
jgi:hypothetical protein